MAGRTSLWREAWCQLLPSVGPQQGCYLDTFSFPAHQQISENMRTLSPLHPNNTVTETFRWSVGDRGYLRQANLPLLSPLFGPADSPWRLKVTSGEPYGIYICAAATSVEKQTALSRHVDYTIHVEGAKEHLLAKDSATFISQTSSWGYVSGITDADLETSGAVTIVVNIKWERPLRDSVNVMATKRLQPADDYADAEFVCAGNQTPLPAHRFVLSQNLDYFRKLFQKDDVRMRQGRVVIETEFSLTTMRAFLEFTYAGTFINHSPDTTAERKYLVRAAAKYGHADLACAVGHMMVRYDLSSSSFTALMSFAWAHRICASLVKGCIAFYKQNLHTLGKGAELGKWIRTAPQDLVIELCLPGNH